MTRVNLIPVEELADKHLLAEYRELPMVPAALERTLRSKNGLDKKRIASKYTLNTGHVYFFYDTGKFLSKRYDLLVHEMKRRGWNPDPDRTFPEGIFKRNGLYGEYHPAADETQTNRDRIELRIRQKPHLYKDHYERKLAWGQRRFASETTSDNERG